MAKQTGIIKLKGTIGDIAFYKTTDGHLARGKGGIEASRIANDPAFQRTRENNSEFGRAGKAGKLLRIAIRTLLQRAKDKRLVGRLTAALLKIVKSDTTNARGLRTVQDGVVSLLKNFEFNINAKLASTLFASYTTSFDRVSGDGKLNISKFVPTTSIAGPSGTTHYRISLCTAELDFENDVFTSEVDETGIVAYDSVETANIEITTSTNSNSLFPIVQVVSIEFFQEVNGEMYPLKNGAYNAMAVAHAEKA
ncbi:hypothetical protein [Flavicella marina]|uniref:hypothetical protein n=1 Tax=Flavicella marina TaxID=1475951 RepID=UPI001263F04E|nr:hypothetical protein [Flavicella marina]